jgi:hypothetical protein
MGENVVSFDCLRNVLAIPQFVYILPIWVSNAERYEYGANHVTNYHSKNG